MSKAEEPVNRKRAVRTSGPVWRQSPRITTVTSGSAALRHYDIVVVGGGVSGAMVAEALSDGTRTVVVIDKATPGWGSTLASTSLIQHEIDVPLYQLAKKTGRGDAERAWRRSAAAVKSLEAKVRRLGIACSFKRKKTLYVAGDQLKGRGLRTELKARRAAGLEARYVDEEELATDFGITRAAALESDVSGSCNLAQLSAGLLRCARERGLEIVKGLEVTDYMECESEVILSFSSGRLISAGHVVFCTGYEFLEAVAHKDHSTVSTWAVATKVNTRVPEWLPKYVAWEASDPYLYFRTSGDGRLIVGGEDEEDPEAYRSQSKLKKKAQTIRSKLSALLGWKVPAAEFTWAAAFGTTTTGLPYIDTVPDHTRTSAVMGFGGNGVTYSQIASEIVSAAILGKRDPDADLFRFPK